MADPFSDWAEKHSLRVDDGKRTLLDGWLKQYEEDSYEVRAFVFGSTRLLMDDRISGGQTQEALLS